MYHSYDELLKQKQWWQTKFAHPFPFFTTEMKASFYYEGVFGQTSQGIWQVHPWNEFSATSADLTTRLMKAQEDESNFVKTFYLGSKQLSILGDWFLEVYWDRQERFIQRRGTPLIDFDQQIQKPIITRPQGQPQLVVDKNQPDARTLYLNSIWPDPKATCIETARYVVIRRERTFDELKQDEQIGKYINVDKIKGTNLPKLPSHYYDIEPFNPFVKSGNPSNIKGKSPIDEDNPIIEVLELHDLRTGEVESIGNRRVYLGKILRYDNLKTPFVQIKNFEELGKFWSMSDYESAVAPWKLINQKESMMADNELMHLRGYTQIQRDAGAGVAEQYQNLEPGSIIEMNNLGAVNHTRPDLYSPLVLQTKESLLSQVYQPMGMNEILQGASPSSNVRSQEQFATLANFGAKIMSQGIRNISQGLKELGKKWLLMNYEFLDVDQTIPVVGQNGTQMIRIQPGDIPPTANISVRISSDLEAQKGQKLQQLLQALNLVQNIPGFNTPALARQWLKKYGDVEDIDKMFLLPDEQVVQLILSQFGIQGSGGPGNLPQEPALAGATQPGSPSQVASGNRQSGQPTVPQV